MTKHGGTSKLCRLYVIKRHIYIYVLALGYICVCVCVCVCVPVFINYINFAVAF
jgi:hypothetical protein